MQISIFTFLLTYKAKTQKTISIIQENMIIKICLHLQILNLLFPFYWFDIYHVNQKVHDHLSMADKGEK